MSLKLQLVAVRALFVLILGVVLASVMLPNTSIAWMREHWGWFNWPMLLIERLDTGLNIVHVVLFVLLGMATRLALPPWRVGHIFFALALFGIVTELVQVWVPGRHPRVSDVVVDIVAGLVGWAAMRRLMSQTSRTTRED